MLFIYFSCLIALDVSSNTMLDRSGESRHSCSVSDLMGKAYIPSQLSMILLSFSQMIFYHVKKLRWGVGTNICCTCYMPGTFLGISMHHQII